MSPTATLAVARVLLALIFIVSASAKIVDPSKALGMMEQAGMPMPAFFLAGAVGLLVIGAAALISGRFVRVGVVALAMFLIPTTLIFHVDFDAPGERVAFFKNVGLLGGLLAVDAATVLQQALARSATASAAASTTSI